MDQPGSSKPLLTREDFSGSQTASPEPSLRDHLDVFLRRYRVFTSVFLILMILGSMYIFTRKKIYEAETKVKISSKSASSLATGGDLLSTLSNLAGGTDVATEAEIINSPGLLLDALTKTDTADSNDGAHDPKAKNYNPYASKRGFYPKELEEYFGLYEHPIVYPKWISDISVVKDTSIVSIKAKSLNPHAAQKYANSVAETYLERSLEQNTKATRQGRIFVENEIRKLKKSLDDATFSLATYQKQSGLISPDTQAQAESDQLLSLRLASDQAKTDLAAAQAKLTILRTQVKGATSDVLASQTITENPEFGLVRANLSSLRDELVTRSKEYQAGSIKIRQLKQSIVDEEQRLNSVAKSVITATQKERNPDLDPLLLSYAAAVADQAIAADRAQATKNLFVNQKENLLKYPDQVRKFADLSRESEEYARTLSLLTDKFYELEITEKSGIPDAQVAEPASLPVESIYPKRLLMGLAILIGSLTIAGLTISMLERLDTSLHNPDEVARISGLPIIAAIPRTAEDQPMIGSLQNRQAFLEGFRLLRNGIQFSRPDQPIKTLVVTSSTAAEGKSTVSANLAIAMAMDGKRVLLVDCDLRRPNVHKIFSLDNQVGFTSLVRGQATVEQATRSTTYPDVFVITSGALPPDPTEFLNSVRSRELFAELGSKFDFVVVDSPPTMGISDVQVLAAVVDAVAFVVALDTVAKQHLVASIDLLRRAHANIVGTVINKLESRGGIYGYMSSHYYTYYSDYNNES